MKRCQCLLIGLALLLVTGLFQPLVSASHVQSFVWVREFGTPGSEFAFTVGTDGLGNVYVIGYTDGEFPGQTSFGSQDAFVRKYNGNGDVVWTRQFGSPGFDSAFAVGLDGSGNIYLTGQTGGAFPGQTFFGGIIAAFVRKYDANGNVLSTLQFGTPTGNGAAPASGVAVDGSENIFVAGSTGGLLLGTGPNFGGSDAYVVKIAPSALSGDLIAFKCVRDTIVEEPFTVGEEICTMHPDGTGQVAISGTIDSDDVPSWSPDRAKIAFARKLVFTANSEIFVMNADGSGQEQLTFNEGIDSNPS